MFNFFHQQKWQEDFIGIHLLVSTNLVLLPAVFLTQADSVRLSTWLTGFFILIFFEKPHSLNFNLIKLAWIPEAAYFYEHKKGHYQFL